MYGVLLCAAHMLTVSTASNSVDGGYVVIVVVDGGGRDDDNSECSSPHILPSSVQTHVDHANDGTILACCFPASESQDGAGTM